MLFSGVVPAHAAGDPTDCQESVFDKSEVSTDVQLNQHRYDTGLITFTTVIEVPVSWPLSDGLMLSPKSGSYRKAMRCLLADGEGTEIRGAEQRDGLPVVTATKKVTTVTDTVRVALSDRSSHAIGPWKAKLNATGYHLTLHAPPALRRASWDVTLERDGNNLLAPRPKPLRLASDGTYAWENVQGAQGPQLTMTLDAPWRIRTVAMIGQYPASIFIRGLQAFAVLVVFVPFLFSRWRERRRHPVVLPHLRALTVAVGLQLVIALLNALDFGTYDILTEKTDMDVVLFRGVDLSWAYQGVIAAAWMAVAVAMFHLGVLRHVARVWVSLVLGSGAAAVAVVFYRVGHRAEIVLALDGVLSLLVFAGTAGVCLAAWRAARGRDTGWQHAGVSLTVGALAAALTLGSFLRNIIDTQRHQRWLLDNTSLDLDFDLVNYPSYLYDALVFTWWFAVLAALVPVLKSLPLGPTRRSVRLLVVVLGGIVLEDWPDWYAGVPVSLIPLTTTVVLLMGIRINKSHVLLTKRLTAASSGTTPPGDTLGELVAWGPPSILADLRATALAYHSLEREGRKLDAAWNSASDVDAEGYHQKRGSIERELARLSDWPPPTNGAASGRLRIRRGRRRNNNAVGRLPVGVTPVDVAMSLGPSTTPWQNGLRASQYMTIMSLPVVLYLYKENYDPSWFAQWFGSLSLAYWVLIPPLAWASSGFLLGFFWHELPGTRGPVKILPIALAYVIGMLLDSFVRYALDQSAANYQWGVTGLLTIALTITSVMMDANTLRAQRSSWATSWSPLASVYRLGAAHTAVALAVAQVAAIVSLWLQLRTGMDSGGAGSGSPTEGK
ncbi:DUF6185 family protein [Streptomyces prunicolor]|uniref:DUF6185 family protein n=1 Tax=Streptomyces prunicolor TaxID=67348 RepID=UPI0022586B71|nr:DUF6185 family protein [Streptomyces prunicolor]MCX5242576.1 DUF6185 family protein [Streptomyces prunicolor]